MFEKLEDILISFKIKKDRVIKKAVIKLNNEDGTVVETVIIFLVLAILAFAVVSTIGGAVKGKAQDTANVIGSVSFN